MGLSICFLWLLLWICTWSSITMSGIGAQLINSSSRWVLWNRLKWKTNANIFEKYHQTKKKNISLTILYLLFWFGSFVNIHTENQIKYIQNYEKTFAWYLLYTWFEDSTLYLYLFLLFYMSLSLLLSISRRSLFQNCQTMCKDWSKWDKEESV